MVRCQNVRSWQQVGRWGMGEGAELVEERGPRCALPHRDFPLRVEIDHLQPIENALSCHPSSESAKLQGWWPIYH